MPRRSSRAVPASAAAPAPAPKRRASDRLSAGSKTAPKRQKYNPAAAAKKNSVKSTARKSKYFEQDTAEESVSEPDPETSLDSTSAYEDTKTTSTDPESSVSEADFTDEDKGKKKKGKSSSQGVKAKPRRKQNEKQDDDTPGDDDDETTLKDKELWKEGVSTGLGPGKEVFIKKPKARDPGKVHYQDDTLHPNTMLFLKDLAENNERQWFKAHDPDYRAAKKDWETFVESLTEKIIEKDGTIPELPAKDLVFRIHRDTRFSKNPTPYKTHLSAAWSRTGKKGPYAFYYVHMQPGSCFVGSGIWQPEPNQLALLREEIDQNSHHLKAVLRRPELRHEIFKGISDDEDKAVECFFDQNKETALKTKPKGYNVDNENIQLLRLRNFTIGRPLADAELMSPNAQEKIATLIGIMEPFVTYLNSVVMPDPADQDPSSDSDPPGEDS
ncbi:hypothetical protein ASPWEDRAFT_35776 [Aspergillus wentii DTO 134E9]|uniref:TIGR02453 family protein n=1 Tax=Aspergillus wentii DTO 134E9 TaxID=1073089 RepID=A0A1L9RTQ1_ASPWE|nr:uncharacterized protein ASPWEDRAFT_35776 [Aspergillus wentii DTO 134E9]OJJ38187.1 hypothetical protein ASPWEDRAFT_35776 [Aspergillus wentii DTO 134E9]